jgi:adenylate cyclase
VSDGQDGSLWDKLRRRKVVQWGIAYVAAGWGLLQGLDYVGGAFHWPEGLQRFAIVGFIAGLPIALVVAWYHGDRGRQKVSGTEFAILTGLLLIGGGMFWWLDRLPVTAAPPAARPTTDARTASVAAAGPSIAVLPFVNMSGDRNNEYFADGISEELLNVLVRVPGLGVASRTSSFAYKGSKLGTTEIAKELKVDHVLEGSVRKSGKRVRITAQLIDARDDRHLWSQTYDRELDDIFAIQEEIANSIVDALQAQLGAAHAVKQVTVRADTENLEAYQIYLKAREIFIARSDVAESIRLFEKVTQLDPHFARGWEGLAAACSIATSWGLYDRDYDAIALKAARSALELDPSLSMPWAAIAMAGQNRLPVDWGENLALYDKALAADPRNSTALLWRSIDWGTLGFFDRAVADADRCLALEPRYYNCTRWKALYLLWSGRTDEATRLFEQGVATGFVTNHATSFVAVILQRGDRIGARLLLKELGASPEVSAIILRSLESPRPIALSPAEAASLQSALDDHASTFESHIGTAMSYLWLKQYDRIATAWDFSTGGVSHWEVGLPGFRGSPGFKAILAKIGVPPYWREHGFPPQCRPLGKQDYTCD